MDIFELIKKSNGDILSIFLFIGLIIYFMLIKNKTYIEYGFLIFCIFAFFIDLKIVINILNNK